jgi:hypothetical protein
MSSAAGTGSRHVVLLAFHYPPLVNPGSQRAAAFARRLPTFGWTPVVITARAGLCHHDPAHVGPPVRTIRVPCPQPSKLVRALGRHRVDARSKSVDEVHRGVALNRLRRFVRDYVYVPDGQVGWIGFAVVAIRRVVGSLPPGAVLVSTSVPYSAHLAALVAARLEGVAWLAEFRDPWSQLDDELRRRGRARKWIDTVLESWVASNADGLIATTELTRQSMQELYPRARVFLVRSGIEPAEFTDGTSPGPHEPLTLVHAGSVRPEVALQPLLRGIADVVRERPDGVRLQVVGPSDPWQRAAREMGGLEWLDLKGISSPQVARQAVANSSASVVLYPGEVKAQYVAAKLMDSLGAHRPIIGIFSRAGEMAALAVEYGDLRLVDPYGQAEVAAVVRSLCEDHRAGLLADRVVASRSDEELSMEAQASHLATVLESCRFPDM